MVWSMCSAHTRYNCTDKILNVHGRSAPEFKISTSISLEELLLNCCCVNFVHFVHDEFVALTSHTPHTANPTELHQLLREDWKGVFNLYDDDIAAPQWKDFLQEYEQELREAAKECHIPRLTPPMAAGWDPKA